MCILWYNGGNGYQNLTQLTLSSVLERTDKFKDWKKLRF